MHFPLSFPQEDEEGFNDGEVDDEEEEEEAGKCRTEIGKIITSL